MQGKVSKLLAEGGLPRRAVTPDEMRAIEPTLQGQYFGGYYTESDSTGDIHKYTHGLSLACERLGVNLLTGHTVSGVRSSGTAAHVTLDSGLVVTADAVVVCAGVHSRGLGAQLGDRLNVYPVKGYSITVMLNDAQSQAAAPTSACWTTKPSSSPAAWGQTASVWRAQPSSTALTTTSALTAFARW
jgi:D-amino-acid dehydrogenase